MNVAIGERYAGIILNKNGTLSHHLILLPQQPDGRLNWDEAMAWAEKAGGTLPTRQEQHILFANCKDAFEPAWYWSCEQYAGNTSYAWGQDFVSGHQDTSDKGHKGRGRGRGRVRAVRAVRRVYA